jgi:hypothetical protein
MIKSKTIFGTIFGKKAIHFAMALTAVSCLGVAVAAPLPITPKGKIYDANRSDSTERTALAPLAAGPAVELNRLAGREDEDCITITRVTDAQGRVYPTRGYVCRD